MIQQAQPNILNEEALPYQSKKALFNPDSHEFHNHKYTSFTEHVIMYNNFELITVFEVVVDHFTQTPLLTMSDKLYKSHIDDSTGLRHSITFKVSRNCSTIFRFSLKLSVFGIKFFIHRRFIFVKETNIRRIVQH